jgi:hypothetical protein
MKESKLKFTEKEIMTFTITLLAVILIGAIIFGQVGLAWALSAVLMLMATIHLIVLFRTKNPIYLIPWATYTLWTLTFFPLLADHPGHKIFAIASGVFLIAFIWVLATKKLNWRYRDILELAAKAVDETADGFTSRPYAAGQAEFTIKEALGFARFLLKHVICFPVVESDRVVLIIPRVMWTYLLGFKGNYDKATYVALTDSREIIVRIAQSDYQKFKEELTFDQLCLSLGELFKQFLKYYQEGKPEKIIQRLNAL